MGEAEAKPDYLEHRSRLRTRLISGGPEALAEYEILELLLAAGNPRGDTKPLAKELLRQFGDLAAVLTAPPDKLRQIKGLKDAGIGSLKVVAAAALRMARSEAKAQPVIGSWDKLRDYLSIALAHEPVECFHLLFLDRKNRLIADERQQRGTVDHTPVYPREVVKRALELGASALILVHNHPSGDTTPSRADIEMTRVIVEVAKPLGITVHDHIIVGKDGHASLKGLDLI